MPRILGPLPAANSVRLLVATVVASLFFPPSSRDAVGQDPGQLRQQGQALYKQGDYDRAAKVFAEAAAAATRIYGANERSTDLIVNELAMACYSAGRLTEAAENFQRVLRNTEARLGAQDPEVATCLNNLARVYGEAGDYDQEEATANRSFEILKARYGENHPYLATNLHNLAGIAANRGAAVEALALYRRALQAYESAAPREEERIANTLNSMASTHATLGQFAEAEALYKKSLAIREAIRGADHPSLAITLNNLGTLYCDQKRYVESEKLHRRSLEIRRTKLGPDHPGVAVPLSNLSIVLSDLGRFEEAEKALLEALRIREKALGVRHPSYAVTLNNLAVAYQYLGQLEKAEELFQKCVEINRTVYGSQHPELAMVLGTHGLLHARRERWDDAAKSIDEARRIVRNYVAQTLPAMSERDQLNYLKIRDEKALHNGLSLGLARKTDPALVARSAEWLINGKGISQQVMAQRTRQELDSLDPAIAVEARRLPAVQREIARLMNSAKATEAATAAQIETLRRQEQELAQRISTATGRPVQEQRWIELSEVRSKVAKKSVLIDVARIRMRNFAAMGANDRWQEARYAAWIVPAEGAGPVTLVDLGPADAVDAAVLEARAAVESTRATLKKVGEIEAEQELKKSLKKLADLVFAPLTPHLGDVEQLTLSPDSSLWLAPWAALPADGENYLIEKYRLAFVVSGRDLFTAAARPNSGTSVVFADPNYDLPIVSAMTTIQNLYRNSVAPKPSRVRPSFLLPKVERLPFTAVEAGTIAPMLENYVGKAPTTHLEGDALETVVRDVKRPRVLVVSTHGFFLEDSKANIDDANKVAENPLLRCGLLMAGSNTRELGGRTDADDGVLTGQEIVALDLRGTELVVLSACQTALGEVRNGEGVAGLRQAFQLAGARSVVSTLWEIPDGQTTMLMRDFFGDLVAGKSATAAMQTAQRSVIRWRRDKYGAAHPHYWAAFTLTGGQ